MVRNYSVHLKESKSMLMICPLAGRGEGEIRPHYRLFPFSYSREQNWMILIRYTLCPDLQMADNAVVLRPIQAACGCRSKVASPSNQKVSSRRVTAPLRAAMRA